MIRDIRLSASGPDEDELYEPPTWEVSLCVIGGKACFTLYERATEGSDELTTRASFDLPARSLLLALQAAYDDDRHFDG